MSTTGTSQVLTGAAPTTTVVGAAPRRALRGTGAWLRRTATSARWYVRELLGDSAYDKYVARHHLEHPDHEPMSQRAWWRERAEAEAVNPQPRCC
ncbi:YbdD/YjiX family protein [Georgenia yuyongxinii]|uniref:YbdD/YjiX family protein n=1 Tax=Georgenia yuyongxinii TaxID=2589797 RepID=A0A552WWZ1_9MICO|nr:YbdD/YjiX family protein [Georgenia yuyongxinii]TRW47307.1 YbdD/YjiX family protein [Georgenia yuyongxinii]